LGDGAARAGISFVREEPVPFSNDHGFDYFLDQVIADFDMTVFRYTR
jgi:hypothetical protein